MSDLQILINLKANHLKIHLLSSVGFIWLLSTLVIAADDASANWPQAAGQNHDWTVKTDRPVPLKWSAEHDQNIRWRIALPETGQSGIAIWRDRLFLTTMKPLAVNATEKKGADIVHHRSSSVGKRRQSKERGRA